MDLSSFPCACLVVPWVLDLGLHEMHVLVLVGERSLSFWLPCCWGGSLSVCLFQSLLLLVGYLAFVLTLDVLHILLFRLCFGDDSFW